MKYKRTMIRSAVIISIVAASILIGFAYQAICHMIDLKNNPRPKEFSEFIEKYSDEFGVSEDVIYAVVRYKSNFISNAVGNDGGIGLMGIKPDDFNWLLSLTKEDFTKGMLYDPETNIKYGTYMISYLYNSYGRWPPVFAALVSERRIVDEWANDEGNLDENGYITKIPDAQIASKSEELSAIVEKYKELYYGEE